MALEQQPKLFARSWYSLAWNASTWFGWALVAYAVFHLNPSDWLQTGPQMLMVVSVVLLSELRPIVMTRMHDNPVSLSLAFVFATMYVWGIYPAILLQALAVALSEILERKPVWKLLFNVGQYSISMAAGWLVMVAAGVTPTASSPLPSLSLQDIGWLFGSWVAFHLVNLALVATLASEHGQSWWENFSDEFWFYTFSAFAVLALAPLIAATVMPGSASWSLLPLLLLPLFAVQRTAEMSREREHEALHDPLTGLPNRVLLTDRIEHSLDRADRASGQVILLFLDLDMFKVVNDGLGHAAGDALLVDVSRRLTAALRQGDTLARFGGDEFAVVCEDVAEDEMGILAERVKEALRPPFQFEGRQVAVTASIGVTRSNSRSTAETMLRDADAAMYRAKAAGRDRVVFFHEAMNAQDAARLDTEVALRQALVRGQMRVRYQPVIDLASGRVLGLEALMRWEHPTLGLVGPGRFIPLAEETGLIVELGQWILQESLGQLRTWRDRLPGMGQLWVAVNISARQLQDTQFVREVARSLDRAGVPAELLHLEITESVVMNSLETTMAKLHELRAIGVSLSVDDFGTGYSSLSYLKKLPVTTLKIDHSFIDGLDQPESSDLPIVDAIVNLARSLDLATVAEGVESQTQIDVLRRLGVSAAQGYHWSPPLPSAEATRVLANQDMLIPAQRGA